MSDIWARQALIGRQLGIWGAGSVVAGVGLGIAGQASGSRSLRAFGAQNGAWGAVDLGIATFGELRRRGRLATVEDPYGPATQEAERRSLRRVLLVNAGLDVGYLAGATAGLVWSGLRGSGAGDPVAGHSAAVLIQGAFLLGFDTLHARALRA
jgi:Family of unknown function (DUF6992)